MHTHTCQARVLGAAGTACGALHNCTPFIARGFEKLELLASRERKFGFVVLGTCVVDLSLCTGKTRRRLRRSSG